MTQESGVIKVNSTTDWRAFFQDFNQGLVNVTLYESKNEVSSDLADQNFENLHMSLTVSNF